MINSITLIDKILDHPTDILCLVEKNSFAIIEANKAFTKELGIAHPDLVRGKSLLALANHQMEKGKLDQIIDDLSNYSYYSGFDCIPEYGITITELKVENTIHWLIRLTSKKERNVIEQYKLLFEKNVAGVYKTSFEGSLISCNEAFIRMLGWNSQEEIFSLSAENFYPESNDRQSFLRDISEQAVLVNYEVKLKRKDGVVITCLENTFLEVDAEGNKIISGTIIDITAQKAAEKSIQESEQRFKTLANATSEGVVFIRKDKTIIDVNDQFALLFGFFSRQDISGKKINEFLPEPELSRVQAGIQISSANKSEIRALDRSGKFLFLEVTGSNISYQGEAVTVLVVHDITARKKAEFTLEQTVVRFKNLLENSPNAIIILTDEKIKYVNSVAVHLLGVQDEDDLYDQPFLDYIPGYYKNEIRKDLSAVREGEELDYKEIRIKDESGKEIDVGILSTLTIYENRPSIQISLNNISERMQLVQEQMRVRIIEEINTVLKREIEEHKLTQQQLEEQKNYNRNIIESSLDMIIAVDEDGYITEFNNASQQLFGYETHEVLGQPLRMLYVSEDEYRIVKDTLRSNSTFSGEIVNQKKDGTAFTSYLSASLIRNDKGRIIGSMGVSRDITEYRANERKAMEQKAKLESIFNSTENMMMWTMDRGNAITTMNQNVASWAASELNEELSLGTDILEILRKHLDEDYHQGQLDYFQEAFDGRPQQFEIPLRNKEKSIIWLQVFLNPVYIGDSQEEVSCLVYDNTERKEIDRKIRDSLKEKEVLLQEVHHRVKNNLQVISSILNLQSSYVTDQGTLEILQESQNRIKSMSFIHETLYRTTDFSSINFSEYIRTLSYNLIQSYRLSNCQVEFLPDIDFVEMSIDQAIPCGLIVNELVSNALKYAYKDRDNGKLSIALKEDQGKISLRIADDGVGLPKNFKFEKNDSLGIQLVYSLTEQLDGTIQVESDNGTTFLINFEKK